MQQACTKREDSTWLMGKVIHWELCKKLKFDHRNKWYLCNLESVLENETHKFLEFWDKNWSPNLSQMTKPSDSQKKKKKRRTCRIVDFAVLADRKVKLNENEKKDKYIDLARERKKQLNMKVVVIPVVIGTLDTVTKRLVHRLEDLEIRLRVATMQTTASLKSARILIRVLETWRDLLSLKLQ